MVFPSAELRLLHGGFDQSGAGLIQKVMGLTILDFSQRFGTVEPLVKVPVVGEFVMA